MKIKIMKKGKFMLTLVFLLSIGGAAYSQGKQVETKLKDTKPISVIVYKSASCQCCSKWAAYMKENGCSVTIKPTTNLAAIKAQYGVPANLRSCHTALVDGYVVEGHVPAAMVKKLLNERPDAKGIAVPGMPVGSPGMGESGDPYKIFLFDKQDSQSVYGIGGNKD